MPSSTLREIIVSNKLWFVRPWPLLVPIPLGGPSDEGWNGFGVAKGVVQDTINKAKLASMLFGGGANQRSLVSSECVMSYL